MKPTQKIVPNLWFEGNAKEAVEFYTSVFPDSVVTFVSHYPDSAEEGLADFQRDLAGKELALGFSLAGYNFVAINAGPEFKPTPAISFFVNFDPSQRSTAREDLDALWQKLSDGGEALMELGEYPFSKRYGWVRDKYGFSWQLMLTDPAGDPRPFIVPSLLFKGDNAHRAEEAISYYVGVFEDSATGTLARYEQADRGAKPGDLMYGEFRVQDQWFAAMDSPVEHGFSFNEAVSLAVNCKDQVEIDELWSKLSAHPENEQCGWCKDKFGVSWQIVPENMEELMRTPGAFAKLMPMKKIVIDEFTQA